MEKLIAGVKSQFIVIIQFCLKNMIKEHFNSSIQRPDYKLLILISKASCLASRP
jgi:hypothetical protein